MRPRERGCWPPPILAQDAAGWISDFSVLSGLTSLTFLQLTGASISDVGALSGLKSLTDLDLNRHVGLRNIDGS